MLSLFANGGDRALLAQAETTCVVAEAIEKKASYNLACVYARQERDDECEAQLKRCKVDGTLPSVEHLRADEDLKIYRDRDWFKALAAG